MCLGSNRGARQDQEVVPIRTIMAAMSSTRTKRSALLLSGTSTLPVLSGLLEDTAASCARSAHRCPSSVL